MKEDTMKEDTQWMTNIKSKEMIFALQSKAGGENYGLTMGTYLGNKCTLRNISTDRDMLWPIPAVEIERNPNLQQNPGW
jgi:hypothetical protein